VRADGFRGRGRGFVIAAMISAPWLIHVSPRTMITDSYDYTT
jgi:hypothetical protein